MTEATSFKLTYSTMFNPPEELHTRFAQGLEKVKTGLGREYPMLINGQERFSADKHYAHSPINTEMHLATFQKGTAQDAADAVAAAKAAFPAWSRMNWEERVYLLRKAAENIDARIYEISAAMALEVGKNRMESLGEVAEAADLIRYACAQMEANGGFIRQMNSDPLSGFVSTNQSVLRPYGVWLVISPFNFPASLTCGPAGAALVSGNTVVMKPASDTSWSPALLVDCMRQAGIPDGVFNFVTGPGSTLGEALINNPDVAGITFTGSYEVGMNIYCNFGHARYVRPTILELGGKNPVLVSRLADVEDAALGSVRSAFGLQGQKCSACSRVFIEEPLYEAVTKRMVELTEKLSIGDPTELQTYMGPVINKKSYTDYQRFMEDLSAAGKVLVGGKTLTEGALAKGYFCAPTIVADVPLSHPLWKQEMFVPIVMVSPVKDLQEGIALANDVQYGLTAGFYGSPSESEWFFDHIEAGVVYTNRPQGGTTGAWPGFQPFGGWKGSGSSGKNSGGLYYVPLYMREQIRNRVRRL
ncbi:MAG TPA: aldehyde dehydrogenase family protein [Anaerolineaceae bacterium]|nr:aldehyde dehydrogenase family protein [Anaerolineaceae bacterium]